MRTQCISNDVATTLNYTAYHINKKSFFFQSGIQHNTIPRPRPYITFFTWGGGGATCTYICINNSNGVSEACRSTLGRTYNVTTHTTMTLKKRHKGMTGKVFWGQAHHHHHFQSYSYWQSPLFLHVDSSLVMSSACMHC